MSALVDRCVEEVLLQGHCLLRDCFPSAAVEACAEAFLPLLAEGSRRQSPEPGHPPLEAHEQTPMLLGLFYQALPEEERCLLRRLERTPG